MGDWVRANHALPRRHLPRRRPAARRAAREERAALVLGPRGLGAGRPLDRRPLPRGTPSSIARSSRRSSPAARRARVRSRASTCSRRSNSSRRSSSRSAPSRATGSAAEPRGVSACARMKTQIRRVLALVCVALFAVQVAKAAPAPTPAEIAASHARAVAQRLADWTILHDAHLTRRPALPDFHPRAAGCSQADPPQPTQQRRSGAVGCRFSERLCQKPRRAEGAGGAAGRPRRGGSRARWPGTRSNMRLRGCASPATPATPAWAQAPRASHAVAQHIEARAPGSSERISISTYELQDTTDPRVVYGFSISASGKAIPQSLVRTLLGLAA